MRLCRAIDQTPASFLRHRKDWPHRSVVLMQSSEREEGIFCHSSTPIVATGGFVSRDWDWDLARGSGDGKLWSVLSPRVPRRHMTLGS
jgi:hypothetical protein